MLFFRRSLVFLVIAGFAVAFAPPPPSKPPVAGAAAVAPPPTKPPPPVAGFAAVASAVDLNSPPADAVHCEVTSDCPGAAFRLGNRCVQCRAGSNCKVGVKPDGKPCYRVAGLLPPDCKVYIQVAADGNPAQLNHAEELWWKNHHREL